MLLSCWWRKPPEIYHCLVEHLHQETANKKRRTANGNGGNQERQHLTLSEPIRLTHYAAFAADFVLSLALIETGSFR